MTGGKDRKINKEAFMSNFHSTVSRRDFMKALGLAGFGLGAAGAATPVFHDLDELISSKPEVRESPWWVKEREFEDPTVEIDWSLKTHYDCNLWHSWISKETAQEWQEKQAELIREAVANNTPGNTLKDIALVNMGYIGAGPDPFNYSQLSIPEPVILDTLETSGQIDNKYGLTRTQLGIPKWQGTPEENSAMVAAVLHFLGSTRVGYVSINENNKKVWFSPDDANRIISWGDVEEPVNTPGIPWPGNKLGSLVLPNKCNSLISFVIPQSGISKYHHTALSRAAFSLSYAESTIISARLQIFLKTLGYDGVGLGASASNVGFGVLAGNGELGRLNYLVNPWHGALIRKADFMLTDLPLAPTRPIDSGITRFCATCKKCAEMCPGGALSLADGPSWDTLSAQNGLGVKNYADDKRKCRPWAIPPSPNTVGNCCVCQAVCVFSKLEEASVHDIIKPVVSQTPLFNRFFKRMDDMFNYNNPENPEEWWSRDYKNYPYSRAVPGN